MLCLTTFYKSVSKYCNALAIAADFFSVQTTKSFELDKKCWILLLIQFLRGTESKKVFILYFANKYSTESDQKTSLCNLISHISRFNPEKKNFSSRNKKSK
jgi:hypothetical protein